MTGHPSHEPGAERLAPARVCAPADSYTLTLFVSGASDASAHAIANVREICDTHLSGRHELRIVDLNQEPAEAGRHHILATPTLVKDHPRPTCMVVGDMSDHARILLALDVPVALDLPGAVAMAVVAPVASAASADAASDQTA